MRGLLPFLASRLLRAAIALWLVSTVVFVVMRLSGDPVPLFLPATFELGLAAFTLALLVALPIGIVSAVKRNSVIDQATMGLALVGQSAPTFFIGILLILIVSLNLGLLPTSGREGWQSLVLPALTLGAFAMASIARLTRSAVLEVLRADYIRTARAKGVTEALVVAKHTLKNAAALAAPVIAPADPIRQSLRGRLAAPTLSGADGRAHLLGTDHLGRDVFSRVIYGARVSLLVGFAAVIVGGLVGATLGLLAGFRGGWTDSMIMTLADAQLAFPFILLAIGIIAVLGPSFPTLIVVIGLSGWGTYARGLRSQVRGVRSREFVEAIHALGGSVGRVVACDILPNVLSSLVVVATLELARAIVLEATLSFLGLGVQPPTPSWGGMIHEGREYLDSAWWISTAPGIVLMLTSIVVSRTGDWLRDLP